MSQLWNPSVETSPVEDKILKLCRKQKLWSFLRLQRHRILDSEMRAGLRAMYADSGRGDPVSPEQLALALVLQVAFHVADHEVPTLTAVDRRWRMVLDCLDSDLDEAAFSQGTVFHFRERAREHGLMQLLLERTVALARETKGFSHKRLRAMVDSSPLLGAGRVEDTFNLIGRALGRLVVVAAARAGREKSELVDELSLTVASAKSVKAALDVDWRLPKAKQEALQVLLDQFERLRQWLTTEFGSEQLEQPPLSDAVALVEKLIEQDTEPDPDAPNSERRIRKGGSDRQISLSDPDMRHGRKSKTKLFSGYKRHLSTDADVPGLVLAVRVLPANVHEHEGAEPLLDRVEAQGFEVTELHHDRGYLSADAIHERRAKGMTIISKPPTPRRRGDRLGKADFEIDTTAGVVTCPAGNQVDINRERKKPAACFPRSKCKVCPLAERCLPAKGQKVISLHPREALHQKMAAELATPEGREQRRERIAVEHALARLGSVQGRRARYHGLKKNQFHTEACAVVVNLYVLGTLWKEAA